MLPSMVLNFLAKTNYLLKDSIFVVSIIALFVGFVKPKIFTFGIISVEFVA